ncbi:hypothetical protein Afil01_68600 [Actinorhabdospora filicis]|uniref:Uncharacterized protein n=1 Tax=Actinorhabdospora filicis TaxID=1785913 RepID=A0A9W6STH9_9ACTN|nr:hypothetical protein [Actinorhabdospora filicis]GLZ82053.1 hypothetical protein Afil01_68600 [Actinorhabdospora filicis]
MRAINRLADRVLGRFVPATKAKADTSWMELCWCDQYHHWSRWCTVVGGLSSCTECKRADGGC